MGYFDGLADGAFKKDSSGRDLYYPWGILGSGLILDSETKKSQIRGFLKKMYMFLIPAILIIQIFFGAWLTLVTSFIFCVGYCLWVIKVTHELPKTDVKLKRSEAYKNSAKSHNLPTLIILELLSLFLVAWGIWFLIYDALLIGYSAITFFGLCAIAIGYMISVKIRN